MPTDINYTGGEVINNLTVRHYNVVGHICYSTYIESYIICDMLFEKGPLDTFI